MKAIDQNSFLLKLEIELEQQLTEVLGIFQNLPEEVLTKPSSSGGWSISECMEHLNTYAAYYQPRIRKALEKMEHANTPVFFKHTWLGQYFINMMNADKSPRKFKAIKKHRPLNSKNSHEVIAEFIHHLEDLLSLLKTSSTKNLNKGSVSTSLSAFIRINTGDALQFLLTHNQRHLQQACRNL